MEMIIKLNIKKQEQLIKRQNQKYNNIEKTVMS